MKAIKLFFIAVVLFAFEGTINLANAELVITDTVVRKPIPGMKNTAAYMTLTNNGIEQINLVAANSLAAKKIEFHDHIMTSGNMKMVKKDQLPISPSSSVELRSGGLHLMLFGLDTKQFAQDRVTINFEDDKGQVYSAIFYTRSVHQEHNH